MSTVNHTPGPWLVKESAAHGAWVAYRQENKQKTLTKIPSTIENARLIASAPDLLEALNQIIWKLERKEVSGSKFDGGVRCEFAKIDRNDAVIAEARSAIAKATGEQS